MFNNLTKSLQSNGRGRGSSVTLQMALIAFSMRDQNQSNEEIAEELGLPSKHSAQYHFFEKQSKFVKKDKDGNAIGEEYKCRSLLRHLYEDHKDPNSGFVDDETFLTRLFAAFGEEYKGGKEGEEQVQELISDYKAEKHGTSA